MEEQQGGRSEAAARRGDDGPAAAALKLCHAQLEAIRERGAVDVPGYDRQALSMGIVHLGVGNFHRSHQAVYADDLLRKHGSDTAMREWGICGAGLLDSDVAMAETMHEQDNLYTLLVRGPAGPRKPRVVGSIVDFIHAVKQPERLIAQMADPRTRIVTLTVTEKGYHYNATTHTLDWDHPSVAHDLTEANRDNPITAVGYVVSALARRRDNNTPSFTVMSCDNLPGNGHITRDVTLQFAERIDPTLAAWIRQHTCFPNSMVDRITPATSDHDRRVLEEQHGLVDMWPVPAEDYIQWVIEDKFSMGRPPWEELENVLVVDEVEPYELMKLRMLNGGHSAMCYAGYLAGFSLVHEAMADTHMHRYVRTYMTQVIPTLPEVPGIDVVEYGDKLLERFGNKYIGDQIIRLTQDGTPKLRGYALPCVYHLLDSNHPVSALALAIAGWLRYMTGRDESDSPIDVLDPLREQLRPLAEAACDTMDPKPFLEAAFGKRVMDATQFCGEVADQLRLLVKEGAMRTIQHFSQANLDTLARRTALA